MEANNVQDVLNWQSPQSVQVRIFLGLVGYYRRFIPDLSKVAKPITDLLKKGVNFTWTRQCEEGFHKLRTVLTSALVLVQPDQGKPFDVFCDASGTGLGCGLMQENQPIAYASRALRTHKRTMLPMILS